jgi:hypothetical protein
MVQFGQEAEPVRALSHVFLVQPVGFGKVFPGRLNAVKPVVNETALVMQVGCLAQAQLFDMDCFQALLRLFMFSRLSFANCHDQIQAWIGWIQLEAL